MPAQWIGLDAPAQGEAVLAGQHQVAHHRVERLARQSSVAFLRIGGGDDFKAVLLQGQGQLAGLGWAVLDDEHARHRSDLPCTHV